MGLYAALEDVVDLGPADLEAPMPAKGWPTGLGGGRNLVCVAPRRGSVWHRRPLLEEVAAALGDLEPADLEAVLLVVVEMLVSHTVAVASLATYHHLGEGRA